MSYINESLLKFFDMQFFFNIDFHFDYWQILLNKLSRTKIIFSSRYDHYEWNILLFNLSNASDAFQRRMNKILRRYIDKFCIVYLDDILIFSKMTKEHERYVKMILHALNNVEMILNLNKCKFFINEIRFLSHIIDKNDNHFDSWNVEKILN